MADAPAPDTLPDPVPPLTDAEKQELTDLYAKLKLEGIAAAREYVLCHVPARLQKELLTHVDADFPPPPPPPAPTTTA